MGTREQPHVNPAPAIVATYKVLKWGKSNKYDYRMDSIIKAEPEDPAFIIKPLICFVRIMGSVIF
jgi:hypothetical protein